MLQQGRQLPAATGQLFRLEVPLECVVSLVANLGAGTLGEFHMGGFLCGSLQIILSPPKRVPSAHETPLSTLAPKLTQKRPPAAAQGRFVSAMPCHGTTAPILMNKSQRNKRQSDGDHIHFCDAIERPSRFPKTIPSCNGKGAQPPDPCSLPLREHL